MTITPDDYLNIANYPDFLQKASALAKRYGLREGRGRNVDYFMEGCDFAILFLLDRDGVSVRYVDLSFKDSSVTYSLGRFLFAHRGAKELPYPGPPQSVRPSAKIPIQLGFFLDLLSSFPDILQGGRDWLKHNGAEKMATPDVWLDDLDRGPKRNEGLVS